MRYYMAGGFARWREIRTLIEAAENRGDEVTHDWTPGGEAVEAGTFEESEDVLEAAGLADLRGVDDAECLIVWLPGCAGTNVEIGYALGLATPIVIYCPPSDLAKVPFYRHPLVLHTDALAYTLDELLDEAEAWAKSWDK